MVGGFKESVCNIIQFRGGTARHSSSGLQPNFAVLRRGRHLCSAGRLSLLAHILVLFPLHTCWCMAHNENAVLLLLLLLVLLLHPFNGLFSRTTCVSRHQKGKSFWILLEQEMMGWQWHQLDPYANHLHFALDR